MIIDNNAVKIDSNVEPSKALNFGISDVRLVVDILSKLYAYPIRTLVQEYICNGRDAMREAGTWGKIPMVITVPNSLEPSFKVRDFGVGISPDRMENVFVNYGSSTKRNTNTQTGGFGIGAKSAFAYTDSFAITSYFNGTKYLYVAHLGDSGGVNLISSEKTSERNGVEISIGVKPKDANEFLGAVSRCVRYWQEEITFIGTKGVDRQVPIVTLGNMCVYSCASSDRTSTIFLIDGIEYPLLKGKDSYFYRNDLESNNHVVAINAPNGHFKIASSRERLENNDDNMQKQNLALYDAENLILSFIDKAIYSVFNSLTLRLETQQKYSGFKLVKHTKVPIDQNSAVENGAVVFKNTEVNFKSLNRSRRGKTSIKLDKSSKFELNTTVLFKSTEPDMMKARKLNHYLESKGDHRKYVSYDEVPLSNDVKNVLFKEVVDVDNLPLPPKTASVSKKKSATGAVCFRIYKGDISSSRWSINFLNNEVKDNEAIFVDEVTDEAKAISQFLPVWHIPKCNKDLVLRKGMTLEQGKKHLLSLHRKDIVNLHTLPVEWKQVNVLQKFKRNTLGSDITKYLLSVFPDVKKEHDTNQAEYDSLLIKYPLIKVLDKLSIYEHYAIKIVVDTINNQSKGDL